MKTHIAMQVALDRCTALWNTNLPNLSPQWQHSHNTWEDTIHHPPWIIF